MEIIFGQFFILLGSDRENNIISVGGINNVMKGTDTPMVQSQLKNFSYIFRLFAYWLARSASTADHVNIHFNVFLRAMGMPPLKLFIFSPLKVYSSYLHVSLLSWRFISGSRNHVFFRVCSHRIDCNWLQGLRSWRCLAHLPH